MAAEVRRLGLGSGLLGLETTKAEGVQAGKGAGVIEGLVAHGTFGQLVDCERGKGEESVSEWVVANQREKGRE